MEVTQKLLLWCIMAGVVLLLVLSSIVLKTLFDSNKKRKEEKIRLFLYEGVKSKHKERLANLIDSFEKAHRFGIIAVGLFMLTRKVRTFRMEATPRIDILYDPTDKDVICIGIAYRETGEGPSYLFNKLIANVAIEDLVQNWYRFEEYVRTEYRRRLERDIKNAP